jgi:NAD(P)-dependent dehydrogenase (short-subunit alcohol dehydrogenase family)
MQTKRKTESSAGRGADRPVALVTGGARRTGLAIARAFVRAGYDLALHYWNSQDAALGAADELGAVGARVQALRADLGQVQESRALVERVFEDFGRLDVLVNSASVFFQDRFDDFRVEDLDRTWQLMCRSPIVLIRSLFDAAKARDQQAAVINIIDQKVRGNFHRDHFSYTLAKTALGHMTTMLAVSCRPVLRINSIYPGLMLPSDWQTEEDFKFASRNSNVLGYTATPDDIGAAALELCSPRYDGAELVLDAGQNLLPVEEDVIYKYRRSQ